MLTQPITAPKFTEHINTQMCDQNTTFLRIYNKDNKSLIEQKQSFAHFYQYCGCIMNKINILYGPWNMFFFCLLEVNNP